MQIDVRPELLEGKRHVAEGQRGDSGNHRLVLQIAKLRQQGINDEGEREEEHRYDVDATVDVLELWLVRVEAYEGECPLGVRLFARAIAI